MSVRETNGTSVLERERVRVGARLAAARERMGWTLADVAATLRIREPHLRAIEAERHEDLPAPAYAIGFVRSYATLLGLDPDDLARRFRDELGGEHRNTDLQFPAPVPERGVPAGALVLLGMVIAVGAYVGWYRLSGERPAPPPVTAPPDRLMTPPVIPPAVNPPTASAAPNSGANAEPATAAPSPLPAPNDAAEAKASPPSSAEPAPEAPAAPANPAPPAAANTVSNPAPSGSGASAVSTSPLAANAAPLPAAAALPPATAAVESHMLIRASADSWVEVRDRKGHVLLNRTLHSGETWPVPDQPEGAPQLLLTTGNAGGTEIVVDGTPAPPLGAAGKVRRDVPLDAALIAGGKPAANSGAHPSSRTQ